jgi:cyclic-di-AMP phosphodiesterase PgpH
MFDRYFRLPLRNILLWILHLTEKKPESSAVKRVDNGFLQKEIKIPPALVAGVSLVAIFGILLFETGLIFERIAGLVLFIAVIFVFLVIYLKHDQQEILADSEAVTLLGLIFISGILVIQLLKLWFPLATPIAGFVIITGLLLSRSLAITVGIILSSILAIFNGFNFQYFYVQLIGSAICVAYIKQIRNRSDLTRLGLRVIVVNLFSILTMHLFGKVGLKEIGTDFVMGIVSGASSILLVLGTLPSLETFFSRITNIKLLELADFNLPLLKRLMIEAPGTYHHSLIMASIAEQAAEAIGANSLLARVGAYYHDIGKLSNPEYFIENQQTIGNPHDPLTPTMSSLVVISHIKDGVALAQKSNIDRVIIECIEQHHGTSLIHYFYHKALEQNKDIDTASFRYPGPKPKTKVSAILMIADASEAACRTLDDPTISRLRDTVEKIINNKFTDGQFEKCPITLQDLSKISESIVVSLSGIYHARIEYQESRPQ